MTDAGAGHDRPVMAEPMIVEPFALALQQAYREARLHSPQGVTDVEEALRSKLAARGLTLTPDVVRALAFAIVTGRDL